MSSKLEAFPLQLKLMNGDNYKSISDKLAYGDYVSSAS